MEEVCSRLARGIASGGGMEPPDVIMDGLDVQSENRDSVVGLSRRLPDTADLLTHGGANLAIQFGNLDLVKMSPNVDLLPPYASYSSWVRLLDTLSNSLPSVLDEAYLDSLGFSDSSIKPLRSALRFLGLVGRDDRPTARLESLVDALHVGGASRLEALRNMILQAYSPLFSPDFDLRTATTEQLRVYFGSLGAQGQIQQKCSSFFLNFARDAGLELPPQLISRAPLALGRNRAGRSSLRTSRQRPAGQEAERRQSTFPASRETSVLREIFPVFDVDWPEEKKQRWFKDFARLIEIYEMGGEHLAG